MTRIAAPILQDQPLRAARVLVGDSVYEDATLTVREGHLYVEFDADDLDSITVDLRALAARR